MKDNYEMTTANKLLMMQGIDLIQNGIDCMDWMDDFLPNENTIDGLLILKNRFHFLR